ncbi:MAG: VOC family protein [Acidimicrobiales bacterium]|nr:VOC family protein [Acidimicrobiales bacterium]
MVTIGQTCINVADLDRSLRFYTAGIGLTLVRQVDFNGLHEVVLQGEGRGSRFQLAYQAEMPVPIEHGTAVRKIYFNVDDCAAAHQRALDAGATSVHEPENLDDYPVTYSMIKDPDGHVIELLEHAGQ